MLPVEKKHEEAVWLQDQQISLINEINSLTDTIEKIQFDDGTIWTESALRNRVITGTTNGETLVGTADSDLLDGFSGGGRINRRSRK